MSTWHFTTYFFFVIIAYGTTALIENSKIGNRKFIINKYCYNINLNMLLFWVVLTVVAVSRNPFLVAATGEYPYANDGQAYIYEFSINYFPGWDFWKIIKMKQTEPLFYILCRIVSTFTANYKYMWLLVYGIIAGLFTYFMFDACDENTCYSIVPLYFTVYLYCLSAVRSGLSIGFALVSLLYLRKRRYFLSIVFFGLGFLSHYIIVFIYITAIAAEIYEKFMCKKNFKKSLLWTLILIIGIVGGCALNILAAVIENTKYKTYLQQGPMTWIGQLMVILCGVLALLCYSEIREIEGVSMLWVHLSIINLGILPLIVNFNIYRVNSYFVFCRIVTWGYILKCISMRLVPTNRKFIKIIVALISIIFFTKNIVDNHEIGYMPFYNQFL